MVTLPEKPTKKTLMIIANIGINFYKVLEIARAEQNKYGLDVIPPNAEMESAAAAYRRLYEHLKHNQSVQPTVNGG